MTESARSGTDVDLADIAAATVTAHNTVAKRMTKWEQRALLHVASTALAGGWDESEFDSEGESDKLRQALESAYRKLLERDLW